LYGALSWGGGLSRSAFVFAALFSTKSLLDYCVLVVVVVVVVFLAALCFSLACFMFVVFIIIIRSNVCVHFASPVRANWMLLLSHVHLSNLSGKVRL